MRNPFQALIDKWKGDVITDGEVALGRWLKKAGDAAPIPSAIAAGKKVRIIHEVQAVIVDDDEP